MQEKARSGRKRFGMSRPVRVGAAVGAAVGLVFFSLYAAISWWVCLGLRECASGWPPYVAVVLLGLGVGALGGAGAVAVARALYRTTKV